MHKIRRTDARTEAQQSSEQLRLCSFDVETTGLSCYHDARIFSYSIGHDDTERMEVQRLDSENEGENRHGWDRLRDFMLDSSIVKVAHNCKFELSFLHAHDIEIADGTVWHDTMIMSQLLRNLSPSHALDWLVWRFGGDPDGSMAKADKAVEVATKANGKRYDLVDKELMTTYQVNDAIRPLLLYHVMYPKICADKRLHADYLNEMALIASTQRMESFGLALDYENMEKLREDLLDKLEKVRDEAYALLGEYVNLGSDTVVARLLYSRYRMPILALTDSGVPSTDKDVILALMVEHDNALLPLILKHRSYTKGLASIRSYTKHVDKRGLIHPNINTNHARTGRESSSSPNLQNVNNNSAEKNPYPVPLRCCIRARPKAFLCFVDYSGIELRLIVNETGELELIQMLKADPDADLHHPTVECFMMPEPYVFKGDKIWETGVAAACALRADDYKRYKTLRRAYKNTGFCIAYGGGTGKVAFTLAKRVDEIRVGDANYRTRFPRINEFTTSIVERVRRKKFVETAFGRKLYVPLDKAYSGSNYLIQGTAAGILKRAQVRVDAWLKRETNDRVRLVLPIHDELVIHYPREMLSERDSILTEVSRIMCDMPEIAVPLRTEWKITATDWASAKEVKLV